MKKDIKTIPLLISVRIDGREEEFEHSVEVTKEEYDFMMRLEEAEADMHQHPWRYLDFHAPFLEDHITWHCVHAVKERYGEVYPNSWRGAGKRVFQPADPSDTEPYEEDLRIERDCELLMVTVGGVTITDENIVGFHACRYYEYNTSPDEALGFDRMDCDTWHCDVFGRDDASVNERARHALYCRADVYFVYEKTLTVDYFDENKEYQRVTQTWKYSKDSNSQTRFSWISDNYMLFEALRRSLRIISKKRISEKRGELRNWAVRVG